MCPFRPTPDAPTISPAGRHEGAHGCPTARYPHDRSYARTHTLAPQHFPSPTAPSSFRTGSPTSSLHRWGSARPPLRNDCFVACNHATKRSALASPTNLAIMADAAPVMVKVSVVPPMMKDGAPLAFVEVELPGLPPVADTPPPATEGEEAPAEPAPPAEDAPPFFKCSELKAKVLAETGLMPEQMQVRARCLAVMSVLASRGDTTEA